MPLVEFRNAGYEISGRTILADLTFAVEAGETLVLLGRSGSGKTTALKMVNGLLFPTRGEVLVDGKATTAWEPIRLKRHIGYVIQDVGLFPHFTVARNVALVPQLEGWPADKVRSRVKELLEQVGLPAAEFAERFPRQLSGGQRQRVGIARALAADPELLLFDEPFGALDPVTRFDAQQMFLALRRNLNKTAIFVTHDVREALQLASRIALLRGGRLEALREPAGFLSEQSEEARAFLRSLGDGPA